MSDGHVFSLFGAELTARASGVLWWAHRRILCVSDLHLGKSDRLARRSGVMTPPYDTADTLFRLQSEIEALAPQIVICLGDMPAVSARHIDKLIAAFDDEEGRSICVPTFQGKRGNPVLWSASLFDEMRNIAGDVGARHLIGEHAADTCEVAMEDNAILLDLDTPQALQAYEEQDKN